MIFHTPCPSFIWYLFIQFHWYSHTIFMTVLYYFLLIVWAIDRTTLKLFFLFLLLQFQKVSWDFLFFNLLLFIFVIPCCFCGNNPYLPHFLLLLHCSNFASIIYTIKIVLDYVSVSSSAKLCVNNWTLLITAPFSLF